MIALDLFAGTGWGVACQRLGIEEYGVEIMPEAIATRAANEMDTIFEDVWEGLVDRPRLINDELRAERRRVVGKLTAGEVLSLYEMLIASPPCQTFSVAGKGSGRKALEDVLFIVNEIRESAIDGREYPVERLRDWGTELGDDRTALVLTPLLYALRDRPTYVTFEQVPTVLPVWEACADVLREAGYSVTTSILNAEQYGVPQTRKRAILIARRDGLEAKAPTPTHSRYHSRDPQRLDTGVKKWVSMAEALGWDAPHGRPSPTVTGGGSATGGAEPFGNGARKKLREDIAREQLWNGRQPVKERGEVHD